MPTSFAWFAEAQPILFKIVSLRVLIKQTLRKILNFSKIEDVCRKEKISFISIKKKDSRMFFISWNPFLFCCEMRLFFQKTPKSE